MHTVCVWYELPLQHRIYHGAKAKKQYETPFMVSEFEDLQHDTTDDKRARPYETVKPLASDLSLEVDISCQRNDYKCVTDVIEGYHGEGNILVCWEHHRMTQIIEYMGDHDAPIYPDDR